MIGQIVLLLILFAALFSVFQPWIDAAEPTNNPEKETGE